MRNIFVLNNRLDESNGTVENVLEMKTKKMPWFLRFAGNLKMATAVVVGIGLLASPFLIQANDEEKTDDAPEVGCLWVTNSGSIGFKVEFDVTAPSDGEELDRFALHQDDDTKPDDEGPAPSAAIRSGYQDWLSIPGFDGGPPLPYSGYLHSFDFTIKGQIVLLSENCWLYPFGGCPQRRLPKWIFRFTLSLIARVIFTR